MSLDLDLTDAGEEVFEVNLTYNYSRMWALAIGAEGRDWDPPRSFFGGETARRCRLVEIEEMTGRASEDVLRPAIESMKADMEKFRKLNPSNGWGNADLLLGHLRRCLSAAVEHPDGVWAAWR